MSEAVIVAAARTPIGRAGKGSLVDARADELAAAAVRGALDQVPELDPGDLEDLYLGCGMPGGEQGFNLARVVAVLLGHDRLPGATVTRYCASSLQALRMAFHAVRAGEGEAFVSAGVECVSRFGRGSSDRPPAGSDQAPRWENPRFAPARARTRARVAAPAGTREPWRDPRDGGGLPDIHLAMGETAENVAERCGVSRAEMDEYAVRSQNRAEAALDAGFWAREIVPFELGPGRTVGADDGPRRGVTLAAVAALQPAFRPDGRVTAANSCPLNDGAAALVVMSRARAAQLGVRPRARILSTAVSALSPELMGLGPVEATARALARAGLTIADIDLVELNEAFAAQVIACQRAIGVADDRLNVMGGAIAVGHPFGMSGARITGTLLNALDWHDGTLGLATMCVGGGQGMAVVVERL